MTHPRAVDLDHGTAMVITDLHGEGAVFDYLIGKFLNLRRLNKVDYLIICGDLIHCRSNYKDESVRMLHRIYQMQAKMGRDKIILLMGNHEMPHVYSFTLAKGSQVFTSTFEQMLSDSGKRNELMQFLESLPFFVRTKAGVLITHAGASAAIKNPHDADHLLTFDHEALLQLADDRLRNRYDVERIKNDQEYLTQARHYLAISGPDDPRVTHLLRGQMLAEQEPDFKFLWDVLFARNEQAWATHTYEQHITPMFLDAISEVSPYELRVIVSGHIGTRGGHTLVGTKQLRLSTYTHAHPNEAGEYLLLDCARSVQTAAELVPYLQPLFE